MADRYYAVMDDASPAMGLMEFTVGGVEEDSLALWHSDTATLFPTYEAARNAIRRTKRYAKRRGMPWPCLYSIIRCKVRGEDQR